MGQAGGIEDPYSPAALAVLTLTNLRIRLLKPHHCPRLTNSPRLHSGVAVRSLRSSADASVPYAIYSLLARGTCLCYGHAEHCLSTGDARDALHSSTVVRDTQCVTGGTFSFLMPVLILKSGKKKLIPVSGYSL